MLRVLPTTKNKPCNLICCEAGLNVCSKTRNIAVQLVLLQCCKTNCAFFVASFTIALFLIVRHKVATARVELHQTVSTVYITLGIARTYLWRQGDQLRRKGPGGTAIYGLYRYVPL